jgi:hypothetical protein
MVYLAPELLHAPALVNVTAFPLDPPLAATVKVLPYAALVGGRVMNVMTCGTKVAEVDWLAVMPL